MNFTLARAHDPKTGTRYRLCRSRYHDRAIIQVLASGKSGWLSVHGIDIPKSETGWAAPAESPDWKAYMATKKLVKGYPAVKGPRKGG